MINVNDEVIFENSVAGRSSFELPETEIPQSSLSDDSLIRKEAPKLAELSELDVIRHYVGLSRKNFSVNTNFYPLGSCTMKYNVRVIEDLGKYADFQSYHPILAQLENGGDYVQGALEVLFKLKRALAEICGMSAFTLQPMAGAHGEFAGLAMIHKYHEDKGNDGKKYVIVPDSSHGTNPATAKQAGYSVISVPTLENGEMDLNAFKEKMTDEVAAVMLTCPDTLGIFNPHTKEICDMAHEKDALVYYDGANLNAILGKVRPGDIGFDVMHVNVHKTFGTPHGGGGPGAGPVGVNDKLKPYLPYPRVREKDGKYRLEYNLEKSIGRLTPFYGHFAVLLKAYAYISLLGKEGLMDVSDKAVLNANYVMKKLKGHFHLPYDRTCMHECVYSASKQVMNGVRALDIAKFLLDKGYHAPTVYFPITVEESMMIEPTETESKDTLDGFIAAMIEAAELAESEPEKLTNAPFHTPISRPDETRAAREVKVCWTEE